MAIECTPTELADLSRCFMCLTMPQREAVKTYLLAVIAGGSTDPATLIEAAKCYQCLTPKQLKMLQPYLMCLVAGGVPVSDCSSLSGSGDPTGSVIPEFSGQLYHDTNADSFYRSTGTTSADWVAIGGAVSYQDMHTAWTPINIELGDIYPVVLKFDTLIENLSLTGVSIQGTNVLSQSVLESVSFPNATNIVGYQSEYGISFESCPLLTSVSAPVLQSTSDSAFIYFFDCPSLLSIDFPSLISIDSILVDSCGVTQIILPNLVSINLNAGIPSGAFKFLNCPVQTVNISSFVPTNGHHFVITGAALDSASVNEILARHVANAGYVSGLVNLSGGTSSAPTGQGITDKATLNARLPGLAVTN